jgi:DNA polymerase-1
LYKATHASEYEVRWADGIWTYYADEEVGISVLESNLHEILSFVGADNYVIALSDNKNFRKELCDTYKANRADQRKPILLEFLREYVQENMPYNSMEELEADDVMGIMATTDNFIEGRKIIVSIDKDLLQIPVDVYNPDKDELSPAEYRDGNYLHMTQTLTGDSVDGYPGCPGIGPVKAKKILDLESDPAARWELVCQAYEKAGLDEDAALLQARLAYILQAKDLTDRGFELWEAPSEE